MLGLGDRRTPRRDTAEGSLWASPFLRNQTRPPPRPNTRLQPRRRRKILSVPERALRMTVYRLYNLTVIEETEIQLVENRLCIFHGVNGYVSRGFLSY